MTTRLVQLTDLHLFEDPSGVLAGVRTWDTFRAILKQVRQTRGADDYSIFTGDIAEDEALDTYLMLREEIEDWLPRVRLIPGNHDSREQLRRAFSDLMMRDQGTLEFLLSTAGWRVVGLDSQITGENHGRVDDSQVTWLRSMLEHEPDTPTLLFMHHPLAPVKDQWLDDPGMSEAASLTRLVETTPAVKIVCSGHLHRSFRGKIGAAELLTTLSTCVDFSTRNGESFDPAMVGFRTFTLEGELHTTKVHFIGE